MKKQLLFFLVLILSLPLWGQRRLNRLSEDTTTQKKTLNYSVVADTSLSATTDNRNYSIDLKYRRTIADRFSTNGIYSVRNINSFYNGPVFDVVNDSDSTGTIYYRNGTVDTAAIMGFAVNPNENVYISKWYDSSGNGLHVRQSDKNKMPKIVINSTLQTQNAKPSVRFDGGDILLRTNTTFETDTLSLMLVMRVSATFNMPLATGDLSSTLGAGMRYTSTVIQLSGNSGYGGAQGSTLLASTDSLDVGELVDVHFTMSADTGALFINNSFISPTTLNKGDYNGQTFHIGGRVTGGVETPTFNGYISEIILFKNDLIAERNSLHQDVNGYFNIDSEAKNTVLNDGHSVTLPPLNTLELGVQVVINTTSNGKNASVISSDSIYAKGNLYGSISTVGNNSYTFQVVKDSRDSLSWKLIGSTDIAYTDADTVGVINLLSGKHLSSKNYETGKIIKLSNGAEYEVVEGLIDGTKADGIGQVSLSNNKYARIRPDGRMIRFSWFEQTTSDADSNHLVGQAALDYARSAPDIDEVLFDYDTATFKNTMYIPPHVTVIGLSNTGAAFDNDQPQTTFVDMQDSTKFLFTLEQTGDFYVMGGGIKDFYIRGVSASSGIFMDSGWGNHAENIYIDGTGNTYIYEGFAVKGGLHFRGENIYVADCRRGFSGLPGATNGGTGSNNTFTRCGAQGGDFGIWNMPRSTFLEINLENQDTVSIYMDNGNRLNIYKIEGERNRQLFDIRNGELVVYGGKYSPGNVSTDLNLYHPIALGTVDTGKVILEEVYLGAFRLSKNTTTANTSKFELSGELYFDQLSHIENYFYDMSDVKIEATGFDGDGGSDDLWQYDRSSQLEESRIDNSHITNSNLSGSLTVNNVTIRREAVNLMTLSNYFTTPGSLDGGNVILSDTVLTDINGDTTSALIIHYVDDISEGLEFIANLNVDSSILAGTTYNVSFYAKKLNDSDGTASVKFNLSSDTEQMTFAPIINTEWARYQNSATATTGAGAMAFRITNGAVAGDSIAIYGLQYSVGRWAKTYQKKPATETDNPRFIVEQNRKLIFDGSIEVTGTLTAQQYRQFHPLLYNAVDTLPIERLESGYEALFISDELNGLDIQLITYGTARNVTADTQVRLSYFDVSAGTYSSFGSATIPNGSNQVTVQGLSQTVEQGDWIYAEVITGGAEANGLSVTLRLQ
ncbi:hypothetical protein [Flavilitoribacter nigricans]|nr:hypothetical protein [Flavilitoribacter nigricans]